MDDGSLIICGGYRRGTSGDKSPYYNMGDKNFTRCSNNQIRLLKSNFIKQNQFMKVQHKLKMVPYFCTSTVSALFKLGVLKQSGIYIYEIKSMLILHNNSNNHLQQKHLKVDFMKLKLKCFGLFSTINWLLKMTKGQIRE